LKPKENRLNISENELMEYIDKQANIVPVRPVGFGVTCTEYAERHSIGFGAAQAILERLVKEGKLQKQEMKYNRHKGQVYFK